MFVTPRGSRSAQARIRVLKKVFCFLSTPLQCLEATQRFEAWLWDCGDLELRELIKQRPAFGCMV